MSLDTSLEGLGINIGDIPRIIGDFGQIRVSKVPIYILAASIHRLDFYPNLLVKVAFINLTQNSSQIVRSGESVYHLSLPNNNTWSSTLVFLTQWRNWYFWFL